MSSPLPPPPPPNPRFIYSVDFSAIVENKNRLQMMYESWHQGHSNRDQNRLHLRFVVVVFSPFFSELLSLPTPFSADWSAMLFRRCQRVCYSFHLFLGCTYIKHIVAFWCLFCCCCVFWQFLLLLLLLLVTFVAFGLFSVIAWCLIISSWQTCDLW